MTAACNFLYGKQVRRLLLSTSWGKLLVVGGSRAGEGTVIILPQMRLALDVGFPLRALVPMENVVVSHGHMDHQGALLPWAAQRQLQNLGPGKVFAPQPLAGALLELLKLGALMEGGQPYPVVVCPVAPGEEVRLRADIRLRFFPTSHWTPTLGTLLLWQKQQLRPEFVHLPQQAIRKLREEGVAVTQTREIPLLAYLADTGAELLEKELWLRQVEVLIVECTFLHAKDRERARKFGHVHLEDLQAFLQGSQNHHVVITHLSRRHRLAAGSRVIRNALTHQDGPKLHLLNVDWP